VNSRSDLCHDDSTINIVPCIIIVIIYTVSQHKTSPSFISPSLVIHCLILIIFGRNIPAKMQLDGVILFLTSPNWCFCTTWGNNLKQKKQINFINFLVILLSDLVNQIACLEIAGCELLLVMQARNDDDDDDVIDRVQDVDISTSLTSMLTL